MIWKSKVLLPATMIVLLTIFLCSSLFSATLGDDEKKVEKSKKAWIGIYMQDLDEDIAEAFDLSTEDGVLINGVIDGSPAEKAGLKEGDVIVRFDNNVIDDIKDLRKIMKSKNPGDNLNIVILRDDEKKDFDIVLGEPQEKSYSYKTIVTSPKGKSKDKNFAYYISQKDHGYLGVFLQDLNDQLAEYFEVEAGVLITKIEDESPAQLAGLKAGDIIVKIGDQDIKSSKAATKAIAKHEKGDKVNVGVIRKGAKKNFTAELDERKMDASWYGMDSNDNNVFKFFGPDQPNFDFQFDFDPADLEFELEGLNSELQEEMKDLRNELMELKQELKEMKNDLK